jgi:hypothetical protein
VGDGGISTFHGTQDLSKNQGSYARSIVSTSVTIVDESAVFLI